MNLDALERYLNSFGRQVVAQAKENLVSADKEGELEKSISFFVTAQKGLLTIKFKMLPYGKYVDRGVSGTDVERKYTDYKGKTILSPFAYSKKQPPSGIIEKWIKRKGLKGRDKKGRFTTHKSLSFLIAKSIKKKGIQGISFFQKPLMLAMQQFSGKFGASLREDIIDSLKQQKIIS